VRAEARRLADEHGRPVRVVWSREDVVRRGPKRPPVAIALADDASGVVRVADPGPAGDARDRIVAGVAAVAPEIAVEFVAVAGPAVTADARAAVWAEVAAARSALEDGPDEVVSPSGARARAEIDADGTVRVAVRCGVPLDEVVVRSYAIGAAHQALGAVRSEGIAVGVDGVPLDLTIRSFGILRAVDTPTILVEVEDDDSPPVNGGDAVFAAVLAAAWRHAGHATRWPVERAPSGEQEAGQ
jgi:CO/xanthine dehydrogenase Mo-binding subunit